MPRHSLRDPVKYLRSIHGLGPRLRVGKFKQGAARTIATRVGTGAPAFHLSVNRAYAYSKLGGDISAAALIVDIR